MSEEISEACGVFGAITGSSKNVFPLMYWGLLSLNHRGQQSYGFVSLYNGRFAKCEDLNLVPTDPRQVRKLARKLKGPIGIANARYATSGGSGKKHLEGGKQPLILSDREREIALSYNGNIVNALKLKKPLEKVFGKFRTDADTEVFGKQLLLLLRENGGNYFSAVSEVLRIVEGAYSAIVLDSESNSLYGFRDSHGIRPLCFGKLNDSYAFSSETPALDISQFFDYGYVAPGELVSIGREGKIDRKILVQKRSAMCSFEFAYFSRPDSILNGTTEPVYKIRERFAHSLAEKYKEKLKGIDLVLSMPETADDAAYGLHEATSIPWERAVRKNRFVTRRAFISGSKERNEVIDKKVNIVKKIVAGKNLALMEDSIVRGDTSKANIAKLKRGGAKSVHLFVTFPKITHPCPYGVDMATFRELIGSDRTAGQIASQIGADSVNYQSIGGLVSSIGLQRNQLCLGCVTGKYPTSQAQELAKKGADMEKSKRFYE